MSWAKWKSIFLGAGVFGLLGPGIGLLLLDACLLRPHTLLGFAQLAFLVYEEWIYAFAVVGPEGLLVGAIDGLIIQNLASRLGSIKLAAVTALAGSVLGCMVPVGSFIVARLLAPRETFRDSAVDYMPTGSLTGAICAIVFLALLRLAGQPNRRGCSAGLS